MSQYFPSKILFFFFNFLQMYCPTENFQWEIRVAFSRESQLWQSRATQPYGARWVFYCFHNPPNSDMDYRIFNVYTYVTACDCTRGCTDTLKESALKVDSGRKIPCRTWESNLCQRRASPMLYQLSYIPTQVTKCGLFCVWYLSHRVSTIRRGVLVGRFVYVLQAGSCSVLFGLIPRFHCPCTTRLVRAGDGDGEKLFLIFT